MKSCINICGYFAEKTSKWPIAKISYRIKVYNVLSNIYISNMTHIIIAGCHDFNDYAVVDKEVMSYIEKFIGKVEIKIKIHISTHMSRLGISILSHIPDSKNFRE